MTTLILVSNLKQNNCDFLKKIDMYLNINNQNNILFSLTISESLPVNRQRWLK